jgi:hypothetical protein
MSEVPLYLIVKQAKSFVDAPFFALVSHLAVHLRRHLKGLV